MKKKAKPQCPYCQSTDVADIVYGLIGVPSEKLEMALSKGEICLGGCCCYEDSPKYHCNNCGKNFPKSEHDPDLWTSPSPDDAN
jgi:hypothetical protein